MIRKARKYEEKNINILNQTTTIYAGLQERIEGVHVQPIQKNWQLILKEVWCKKLDFFFKLLNEMVVINSLIA